MNKKIFASAEPPRMCFCVGPQGDDPACPCAMNELGKSGFFDLPASKHCAHPEHQPPTHIYIPAGKGFRHVCPACGSAVELHGSAVFMGAA